MQKRFKTLLEDHGPDEALRIIEIDEIGRAQIELIITLIDEYTFAIEHRPHRTIEHDDAMRIEETLELRRHRAASPRTA